MPDQEGAWAKEYRQWLDLPLSQFPLGPSEEERATERGWMQWWGFPSEQLPPETPTTDDERAHALQWAQWIGFHIPIGPQPPRITSPLTHTSYVDEPFSYQITATQSPTSYNATGLPPGLSVNTMNGLITGTPTVEGPTDVQISATNDEGTGSATLHVMITTRTPQPGHPWQITYEFPWNRVTFANDPTGRIPLPNWTGWDPAFLADLNDDELYLGPNAPASPAQMRVRMFAQWSPLSSTPPPEVEVDFDKFPPHTTAGNRITLWGFISAGPADWQADVPTIYIQGNNATTQPILLRLVKA